jgi:hypothetical protein
VPQKTTTVTIWGNEGKQPVYGCGVFTTSSQIVVEIMVTSRICSMVMYVTSRWFSTVEDVCETWG